jgi:hypothetical protein
MAILTLTVSEDLKNDIDEMKIIDWSTVAREALEQRVAQLRIFKSIAAKSTLTEKEADRLAVELGRKVKKDIHKRHEKTYNE